MWCLVPVTVTHMRPSPRLQSTGHADPIVWSHDATMDCCYLALLSWLAVIHDNHDPVNLFGAWISPALSRTFLQHSRVKCSTLHALDFNHTTNNTNYQVLVTFSESSSQTYGPLWHRNSIIKSLSYLSLFIVWVCGWILNTLQYTMVKYIWSRP